MSKLTVRIAILCSLPVALFAADPFIGLWKMNAAESTFSGTPPVSMVMQLDAAGERDLNSRNEVLRFRDGKLSTDSCLWKLDANEHTACNSSLLAIKRRVDSRHIEALIRSAAVNGETHRLTYEVSADGEKLTIVAQGVTSQGLHYKNTVVYDKR